MAVEAGEIVRNPSKGIRVDVKREEGVALTPLSTARHRRYGHYLSPYTIVSLDFNTLHPILCVEIGLLLFATK